jgi:aminopeptidase N
MCKLITYLLPIILLHFSTFGQNQATLHGALSPERTCFDVVFYHLSLRILPEKKYIEGNNKVVFKVISPTNKIQLDLFKNLTIDSILFNQQHLTFERKYNAFFINFPDTLPIHTIHQITIYYQGKPKTSQGRHQDVGFHWEKDQQDNFLVGVSCEETGASLWYPNKDHLSDEPDSARLSWTIPRGLECISNGVLEKVELSDDKKEKTWHWKVQNPINNYNITFYAGKYKRLDLVLPIDSLTQRRVECYYYDEPLEKAKTYFSHAAQMIKFCEELFGEYPYWNEKFAIVKAPYRGMEHQTCINTGSILAPNDDGYYPISLPYNRILIHEIAHEWWGNCVSAGDIADIWLHEGFATYVELLYIEYLFGKNYYTTIVRYLKDIPPANSVLGKRHTRDNMFRSNAIYSRGAVILAELRAEIDNDAVFLDILKTFQQRFKHKTVYTEDFITVVNEKTNKDFTKFLMRKLR